MPGIAELARASRGERAGKKKSYEAGSGKKFPRGGSAGARSLSRARGAGAVYVASNAPYESVIGGGDGAFVAAAPLFARSRAFVLYRAKR
jgi:hypothetical protein